MPLHSVAAWLAEVGPADQGNRWEPFKRCSYARSPSACKISGNATGSVGPEGRGAPGGCSSQHDDAHASPQNYPPSPPLSSGPALPVALPQSLQAEGLLA